MGQGPAERPFRVHERKPVRFVVGMSHAGGWQGEARVHDIGLGGAGLEMSGRASAPPSPLLRENDRVALSFIAPTLWDPLEIPARIVWVRPSPPSPALRFGVAFEATDSAKIFALFELVSTFVFDR
ncbi:PilZ domain-containing protein [Pendulispora albinea]|uniref:PilZ domain-containing protein n=1 Tax=Pendulispora albinea TaxID=2741071 RepID=A0ABZ2LYV2_9BACT